MSDLDYDGFVKLVADMRDAQERVMQLVNGGKAKDLKDAVERCKKLQRQVDAIVVRRRCSQPWLFGE